jgi:hypothetical protein
LRSRWCKGDGAEAEQDVEGDERELHANAEAEHCRRRRRAGEDIDEQRLLRTDAGRRDRKNRRETLGHLDEQRVVNVGLEAERPQEPNTT